MKRYVNRTFHIHEGHKMIPDFETMTFKEQHEKLVDCEALPDNFVVEKEYNCKVRMSVEDFIAGGECVKIIE